MSNRKIDGLEVGYRTRSFHSRPMLVIHGRRLAKKSCDQSTLLNGANRSIVNHRSNLTSEASKIYNGPKYCMSLTDGNKLSVKDDSTLGRVSVVYDKKPKLISLFKARYITQSTLVIKTFFLRFKGINPRLIVGALALFLFFIGAYANISTLITNKHIKAQYTQISSGSSNQPSTATYDIDYDTTFISDSDKNNYSVTSDIPRLLTIQKIGINARIIRVGTMPNGEVIVPKNIYDVGWYEGSAKPGEDGVLFIDGHASYPGGPGIFSRLNKMTKGDIVTLEKGDRSKINYKIDKIETVELSSVDMNSVLQPTSKNSENLNIMTCTGTYNSDLRTYSHRLIVYSTRI